MTEPYALLRIYTDEASLDGDARVFEVILKRAKDSGLLGATVLRGRVGFGRVAHAHPLGFLDHNYPLLVEIVDEAARLRSFVASLAELQGIGLATIEPVEILIGGRAASAG